MFWFQKQITKLFHLLNRDFFVSVDHAFSEAGIFNCEYKIVASWCNGYHLCTTSSMQARAHILCRFISCLHVLKNDDGADLWQWSLLEIRSNTFRGSAIPKNQFIMTVCCYHVTYAFQSKYTLYSCLNIKGILVQNRQDIWRLSEWNRTWNPNHLVCKRTLKNLTKLAKWSSYVVSTYINIYNCICSYHVK